MLLIDPYHSTSWHYGVSLGLGYIASVLESKSMKVKVIDYQINEDCEKQILESLKEHHWVGIYISIASITNSLNIAKVIRRQSPRTKIVMGGPHATVIYDKLIPEYADIVVRGEGERTITEVVDSKPLKDIQGIAYWDNGLKTTSSRSLIEDLDSLTFPAFHVFDLKGYKSPGVQRFAVPLITSRGCPYQCIYCGTKITHGTKLRLRSVENVIGEIDYLVKRFKVGEIFIYDDCFTFYPERVKEICNNIIKQRYKDLRFSLYNGVRPDICDDQMFRLMKQAGFYHVRLGIESSSQEILDKANKNLELTKVKETIAAIRKAGIRVGAFFMLGLPFDTKKTMQETIDFAKTLHLNEALFSIATPLPGTRFYEIVKKGGRFLQDLNLQSVDALKPCFEMEHLKAQDMEKMLTKAYRQFCSRSSQIYLTRVHKT